MTACFAITLLKQIDNAEIRNLQGSDLQLGELITQQVTSDTRPAWGEISNKSKAAKDLWAQWDCLEIQEGVLYRLGCTVARVS